jgi:hypothetical protein
MSRILKNSRLLHLYLGIFTAPALIFFSITGALQTFSFHETTRGSDYKPPRIIAELSQLHKKQTLVVPAKKAQAPAQADKPAADKHQADNVAADKHQADNAEDPRENKPQADKSTPRPDEASPAKPKNLLPMKIFFLFVAISLLTSTITGLYMSYKYIRNKRLVTACLAAGIILPVLLTLF